MRGDPVLSRCGHCGAEVLRTREGERPVPMQHAEDCITLVPVFAWRVCEWCGGPMADKKENARCCGQRCKAALWKHEEGYGRYKRRTQRSYTKSSGVQVPRARTLANLRASFQLSFLPERLTPHEALLIAEQVVHESLPARQRALIHARNQKTEQQEAP